MGKYSDTTQIVELESSVSKKAQHVNNESTAGSAFRLQLTPSNMSVSAHCTFIYNVIH